MNGNGAMTYVEEGVIFDNAIPYLNEKTTITLVAYNVVFKPELCSFADVGCNNLLTPVTCILLGERFGNDDGVNTLVT